MLCEKCHANKAVVHITQIINGQRTEQYLCRDCAEKANVIKSPQDLFSTSFKNMFSPFFSWDSGANNLSLFPVIPGMNTALPKPDPAAVLREEKYKAFRDKIKPLFWDAGKEKTEDADINKNYSSGNEKEDTKMDAKMKQMQMELKACIEKEDYEKAAKIRDEIKKYSEEK